MKKFELKNRGTVIAFAAIAAILGIATASMASDLVSDQAPPDRAGTPKAGTETIDSSTTYPGTDKEFALLVYTNKNGETCVATGEPADNRKSVGRKFRDGYVSRPLKESGICGLDPDPIDYAGEFAYDSSSTSRSEALSAVFGVADDDVLRVSLNEQDSGTQLATTAPGKKGGFILALPGTNTALELRASLSDGSVVVRALPSAPSNLPPKPASAP